MPCEVSRPVQRHIIHFTQRRKRTCHRHVTENEPENTRRSLEAGYYWHLFVQVHYKRRDEWFDNVFSYCALSAQLKIGCNCTSSLSNTTNMNKYHTLYNQWLLWYSQIFILVWLSGSKVWHFRCCNIPWPFDVENSVENSAVHVIFNNGFNNIPDCT